jgi:Fic family protein
MVLLDSLSRVDELKREIDNLRPLQPEQERRILDKFRLDWNYHSNAIEGNRLTLGETRAFLMEGVTAHGKPLKDHLDIKGHNEVITFLEDFIRRKEVLTEATIRGLHTILLREPYEVEARTPEGGTTKKMVKLGEYKTEPNFVRTGTGEIHYFLPPQDTPAKMHELMEWFEKESKSKENHPLIVAGIFHHRLTQIHPFDDGNGRMARILMNLILMQHGFPPVVIKTQQREQYLAALAKADAGEQSDLFVLIAEEESNSEYLYLKGAKGEDISEYDDVDKRITLLKQELSNVEPPVPLSAEIQEKYFANCLKPILASLFKKISQFDDLYASNQIWAAGQFLMPGVPNVQQQWNVNGLGRQETLDRFEKEIQRKSLFSHVDFVFAWNGFKKAGHNTFSDQIHLQVWLREYSYSMMALYNQTILFNVEDVYQKLPSKDQISKLAGSVAEALLKRIEGQVRPRTNQRI